MTGLLSLPVAAFTVLAVGGMLDSSDSSVRVMVMLRDSPTVDGAHDYERGRFRGHRGRGG